jgi:ketosteroid isomerase-like protein
MSQTLTPNEAVIVRFYNAFARGNGEEMAGLYHPDVRFSDPVFQDLQGVRAGNMWRMLTSRARDLEVEVSDIFADEHTGRAHWEAKYTFSTGRKVHNKIDATFRFDGGRIIEHTDKFDLWAWSRMALGVPGVLLGWSPIIQGRIRSQALDSLAAWEAKQADAAEASAHTG